MRHILWALSLIAIMGVSLPATACSVFNYHDGDTLMIGRNLDWLPDTPGQVWFEPGEDGDYGVMLFGCDGNGFAQGGMNDQGLVLGAATIPEIEVLDEPEKLTMYYDFWPDVLKTCSTVEEALDTIDLYNLASLPNIYAVAHFLITDASGTSAIIEANHQILGEGDHQMMTNFAITDPEAGYYPCGRYEYLEEFYASEEEMTEDRFITAIEDISGTVWGGFTVYSLYYDLNKMEVSLYPLVA